MFCSVCLISSFKSCGMSFLCAMSLMRVIGTEHVNSPLNDGSHGCTFLMTNTDDSSSDDASRTIVSMLMKTSRATTAMWLGLWWCPSSVHCSTPVLIQRRYVDAAAAFSGNGLEAVGEAGTFPMRFSPGVPTRDWTSSSFWIHDVAAVSPAAIVLNALPSGMFTPPSLRCVASCIRRFSSSWSRCFKKRKSNSPLHSRVAGGGGGAPWGAPLA